MGGIALPLAHYEEAKEKFQRKIPEQNSTPT